MIALPDTRIRSSASGLFYCVQFFYGGWFLFHGLNYWLLFFGQAGSGGGPGLIPALIDSGLFDLVKVLEVVIGIALLANRFVPLAVVAAVPITIVIAYLNLVLKGGAQGWIVGITILAMNGVMAFGHLDRYLPMLAFDAGDPSTTGLRQRDTRGVAATLSLPAHALAIVLGIAVPVAVTFASILL